MAQDEHSARATVSTAVVLISYEGQLIWRSFAALLAANGLLVVLAGIVSQRFASFGGTSLSVSAAGVLICFAWSVITHRQFGYYRYWFACARESESLAGMNIFERGRRYGEGATVEVGSTELRLGFAVRAIRVEWLMQLVIAVFALIYSTLLIASFLAWFVRPAAP